MTRDTAVHDEAGRRGPVRPIGVLRGLNRIARIAWIGDGAAIAALSGGGIFRIWDARTGSVARDLRMEIDSIRSLSCARDRAVLALGTSRGKIQLWSTAGGTMSWELSGHRGAVSALAWSPDGKTVASGSEDLSVRLWNVGTREPPWTFHAHREPITDVAWSPRGDLVGSSSTDGSLLLWRAENGQPFDRIEAHRSGVLAFAWSPDGRHLAIGTEVNTVHVWDLGLGRIRVVLEGHARAVNSVAFSADGRLLASRSTDGNVRLWRLDTWEPVATWDHHVTSPSLCNISFHPVRPVLASVGDDGAAIHLREIDIDRLLEAPALPETARYVNAKVVLVGDTGVGKSGLSLVLCGDRFEATESTHARKVARLGVPQTLRDADGREETREIFLWDLAGQPGYRLVHQLHLGEVAVAVVVFDAASDTDAFAGVGHWVRALRQAQQLEGGVEREMGKLLAAARVDRGSPRVSPERIEQVRRELGFRGYFPTSAKEDIGIETLLAEIRSAIPWDRLPRVTTTSLYRRIREFLVEQKFRRRFLVAEDELFEDFVHHSLERDTLRDQFEHTLRALETEGATATLLSERRWIVLQPELIEPCEALIREAIGFDLRAAGLTAKQWLGVLSTQWPGVIEDAESRGVLPAPFLGIDRAYLVDLIAAVVDQFHARSGSVSDAALSDMAPASAPNPDIVMQDIDRQIRSFIMARKESRRIAIRLDELFDAFVTGDFRSQFASCVWRLESAGAIKRLSFGRLVLLHPELLDAYASGIVNAAQSNADGLGSVLEATVRAGRHGMPRSERLADPSKESLLLIATIEDLLRHEIALREQSEQGAFLVFPSQLTRQRPDLPDPRGKAVVFSFEGPVQSIYATLVVRLSYSQLFTRVDMWKDATTYRSTTGDTCGMFVRELEGGKGRITLFFETGASETTRRNFEKYIHSHLQHRALAGTIELRRLLSCSNPDCNEVFSGSAIRRRLEQRKTDIVCSACETRVALVPDPTWEPPEPGSPTWLMDRSADEHRARVVADTTIDGKRATNDFDVFIAYHTEDLDAVSAIVAQLKQRGLHPWIDVEQIAPGTMFQEEIERVLPRVRATAIMIGPQGLGRWQSLEFRTALARHVELGRPVIPVFLPDVAGLPPTMLFLAQFNRVEFRSLRDDEALDRLEWGITSRRPTLARVDVPEIVTTV